MKLAVIAFSAALACSAATICTNSPVLSPDSVRVCPDAPELRQSIFAFPGTSWDAWANDNPASQGVYGGIETGDGDYNDAHVQVSFSAVNDATLTWIDSNSAWVNVVGYAPEFVSAASPGPVDLGAFSPGAELILSLNTPDGASYLSGQQHGISHWWIAAAPAPIVTPEPTTWTMLAIALLLMSVRLLWIGRKARS